MNKKPASWRCDPNACFWLGVAMGLVPFVVTAIVLSLMLR